MNDWKTEPLEDCLELLLDYRGKSPPKSDEGIPVLSAKVVKTAGLIRPIEQKIARDYMDGAGSASRWRRRYDDRSANG
jgi:type I restriction enzyme S subunit